MSLFDDLLNKNPPASNPTDSSWPSTGWSAQQGGWTPIWGQQDPTTTNPSGIIISESSPIVTMNNIVEPAPVESHTQEDASSILIPTEVESNSIIIDSSPVSFLEESPTEIKETEAPETTIVNEVAETPDASLFEIIDTTPSIIEIEENSSSMSDNKSSETSFSNTSSYISHAIEEVSTLIETLRKSGQAKLDEKEEYRKQKEKYEKLEQETEEAYQQMLIEQGHAEDMKSYLENEKNGKKKTERTKKAE